MTDTITPLEYEIAAQFAHFSSAALIVSQLGRLGFKGLLAGAIGMTVFAAVKEFGYDLPREKPSLKGTSVLDFFFYLAGIGAAIGLWFA